MVLTIKHKFGIYRRFQLDIWGLFISTINMYKSKLTKFFYNIFRKREEYRLSRKRRYIYRIDIVDPKPYEKRIKKTFTGIRLLKYFYLTLEYKQYRKMSIRAVKRDGYYEQWYCLFLEGRIITLFLRANFVKSMFESIAFLKKNGALLNNKHVNYLNFNVNVGDFLRIYPKHIPLIKNNIFSRALKGNFLSNASRYFFVNYKLFYLTLFKYPTNKDLSFPVKVDIYRANTRL